MSRLKNWSKTAPIMMVTMTIMIGMLTGVSKADQFSDFSCNNEAVVQFVRDYHDALARRPGEAEVVWKKFKVTLLQRNCDQQGFANYVFASLVMLQPQSNPESDPDSPIGFSTPKTRALVDLVDRIQKAGKMKFVVAPLEKRGSIVGTYDCESSTITVNVNQAPMNLAATVIHELSHLGRDKFTPFVESSMDWNQRLLYDETLSIIAQAHFQMNMALRSSGRDYLDADETGVFDFRPPISFASRNSLLGFAALGAKHLAKGGPSYEVSFDNNSFSRSGPFVDLFHWTVPKGFFSPLFSMEGILSGHVVALGPVPNIEMGNQHAVGIGGLRVRFSGPQSSPDFNRNWLLTNVAKYYFSDIYKSEFWKKDLPPDVDSWNLAPFEVWLRLQTMPLGARKEQTLSALRTEISKTDAWIDSLGRVSPVCRAFVEARQSGKIPEYLKQRYITLDPDDDPIHPSGDGVKAGGSGIRPCFNFKGVL